MFGKKQRVLIKETLAMACIAKNTHFALQVYALTENNEIRTEAEKWLCLTTEMEALSQTPSANTPVPTVICP